MSYLFYINLRFLLLKYYMRYAINTLWLTTVLPTGRHTIHLIPTANDNAGLLWLWV